MKSISSFFFLIEIIEIPSLPPQAIDFLKRNNKDYSQETLHALITPLRSY